VAEIAPGGGFEGLPGADGEVADYDMWRGRISPVLADGGQRVDLRARVFELAAAAAGNCGTLRQRFRWKTLHR